MNTTKTLAIAAFTALTLGLGTAMAQDEGGGPSFYSPESRPGAQQTVVTPSVVAPTAAATQRGLPQAGSSDVSPNYEIQLYGDHGG